MQKKESDKKLCEAYMETNAVLYNSAYKFISFDKEFAEIKKDRDYWKARFGSVVEDFSKTLAANGVEFSMLIQEVSGDGKWKAVIDIPELNEKKKRISELEKDLDATVKNVKFWHDREKEVEKQLEDLKKENQTLEVKNSDLYNERGVLQAKLVKRGAELECIKSENSKLKKELEDLKRKTVAEVRYEWHSDCFTVIYTKCDGTKEVVGMDLADDTDEKCTMGAFVCRSFNIPQCKNCKNHRYFANTGGHYCHLPDSRYTIPGIFRIDSLTDEEAEGPACDKFEAKE